MPATTEQWTAAQVRALPDDGQRYEAIDGVLAVTPAPSLPHQAAVLALSERIGPYLRDRRIGFVFLSPADIELDPRTLVQPDLFVAPPVDGRRPGSWTDIATLILAVEVISPSSARSDRQLKRHRYQRAGIPEYWIVDPDARLVERWRPGDSRPEVLAERIAWQPLPAAPPLEIDLREYFADVWGEK